MYSRESLKTAITQPRKAAVEANRLWEQGLDLRSSPAHNENGVDILAADWDNLIILDACRYDTFERLGADLPGELSKVESKASATHPFLRANFANEELYDTVYVTANPQLYRIENGITDVNPINVSFHDTVEVWQDGWHEEHRTVMPKVVTEAAIRAREQYPNKRLLIHYLQPHAPYVGETGVKMLPTDYLNFWGSFRSGKFDVSLETARRAYFENVEIVLPHVSELLARFDGRTVVTADHGELLGERDFPIPIRRFGHPAHTNLPVLLEVPWLVHERTPRPEIVLDSPVQEAGEGVPDSEAVRQRLRDLGYTE